MANWLDFISHDEYLGLKATELMVIPSGLTAARPSGADLENGLIYINTDVGASPTIEWYYGGSWYQPGVGGGGGETNTASNVGGGLANWDSKVGVDLKFNTFDATDFDLAANLISIDATLKANWNSAYDNMVTGIAFTGTTTKTLTITQQDGGTLTANFTDDDTTPALNDLTDVTITSVADTQLLKYDSGTSQWINWTPNFLTAQDDDITNQIASAQTADFWISGYGIANILVASDKIEVNKIFGTNYGLVFQNTGGGRIDIGGGASSGFMPYIKLQPDGTTQNASYIGSITTDSGAAPALFLDGGKSGGALTTQDVLAIGSYGNKYVIVKANKSIQFTDYGVGTHTGTAAKMLAVDASGNIIEETLPSPGGSGITRTVSSIATNTSAGATSSVDYVYICTATLTLTLPTAVGNTNLYTIKNAGSGTITVATTSSQTIDGTVGITINPTPANVSISVISDGANWQVV